MLATIVNGEADLADVFFLIGVIVAALGIVVQLVNRAVSITEVCALAALGFVAAGLLVL